MLKIKELVRNEFFESHRIWLARFGINELTTKVNYKEVTKTKQCRIFSCILLLFNNIQKRCNWSMKYKKEQLVSSCLLHFPLKRKMTQEYFYLAFNLYAIIFLNLTCYFIIINF